MGIHKWQLIDELPLTTIPHSDLEELRISMLRFEALHPRPDQPYKPKHTRVNLEFFRRENTGADWTKHKYMSLHLRELGVLLPIFQKAINQAAEKGWL